MATEVDAPQTDNGSEGTAVLPVPADSDYVHKLKVNGKELQLTTQELITKAQQRIAEGDRFEEAKRLKEEALQTAREAEQAMAIVRGLKGLQENPNDKDAIRNLASGLGIEEKELARAVEEHRRKNGQTGQPPGVAGPVSKVGLNELDPEIGEFLKESFEEKMERDVRNSIETDKVLGIYKGQDQQKVVEKLIKKAVKERLGQRATDSIGRQVYRKYGLEVLQEALQEVRQTVSDLGIREASGRLPATGVGRVPQTNGQKPAPTDRRKRPKSNTMEYSDYFNRRLQELQAESS